MVASDAFVVLVEVISIVKVRVVDLCVWLTKTVHWREQAVAVILPQFLWFFLWRRDLAKLTLKRVDGIRMPGQLLEQAFHIDDDPVVKNVIVSFDLHILCTVLLELSLDMFLHFFTTLVFSLLIDFENCIDSFCDRLLVAFLSDLDDLPDDNILHSVLKKVRSVPELLHLLILHDLLLSPLLQLSQLVFVHFKTLLARILALELSDTLLEFVLFP